jgi:hypothetical protein
VQNTRDEALESIETCKNKSIVEVENRKTEAVITVQTTSNNAVNTINKEIEDGKKELKESVEDIKILTTLEIGDIGFTQMVIDETKGKRRALNKVDNIIIQEQYHVLTQRIKKTRDLHPEYFCTEAEWQTELAMSAIGVCYKYVIDDEAGTIRLPKYPDYFVAGLTGNAPVVGNGMALGLTYDGINVRTLAQSGGSSKNTFFSPNYGVVGTDYGSVDGSGTNKIWGVSPNPNYSGLISNLSNDQTEQIKGNYFIQVATGAETEDNIINEIELNNPFSLLDYKYSEYELNNLSWLRSNCQYNSKITHPAVYDLLLKIYNGVETKAGVSVKLSTEAFTDYDFVLNTAEETFRLPVKVKLASGKAVVGNGMTIGLTNGTNNYGLGALVNTAQAIFNNNIYGDKVGSIDGYTSNVPTSAIGLTTDPTKSGIETSDNGLYLYFYVGETVQNANLINAGRIEEKIASLIPDNSSLISGYAMPSGKYVSLTAGADNSKYTAPANGWFAVAGNANGQGMVGFTAELMSTYCWVNTTNGVSAFIPVTKNMQVSLRVINATVTFLRFIYAEGEQ